MSKNVIWIYGWSSDEKMPPYIGACISTVKQNSGCEVIVVTRDDISQYLSYLPSCFYNLRPNHQSDIFRVNILCEYGGMYVDADTIVVKSLRPLFDLLKEYDLICADWRPRNRPTAEWQSIGVSVMGPMRPKLQFMRCAKQRQLELLVGKSAEFDSGYPFKWEELIVPMVSSCFDAHRPHNLCKEGASSWFSLAGGPQWYGGDLQHPLRPYWDVGELPDSELFTLANSCLPADVKWAKVDDLLARDTILAKLLSDALKGVSTKP
jgi:Capsular polysaccharide synthesis protein